MITVPEAARRVGRDPETVRRWIRAGKLRSTRVGTQHLIDEEDLADLQDSAARTALPHRWTTAADGTRMPDFTAIVREGRDAS